MNNLEKRGLVCKTSKKEDGNMSLAHGPKEEVKQNRREFVENQEGNPDNYIVLKATHGDSVFIINKDEEPETDADAAGDALLQAEAVITNDPEVMLMLPTADCSPIVFYDPVNNVMALAHLGWKPSHKGLVKKVIAQMQENFGTNPGDLVINVGPSIHEESYIVNSISDEQKNDPRWQPFIKPTDDGRFSIDIIGFNKQQLLEAGVSEENIEVSDVDTYANEEYFSHRRKQEKGKEEVDHGNMVTVAQLPVETPVQER